MVLLGDKAILDAHFGLFGDRLRNHFRHTGWNTGDVGHVESLFDLF
jgi:hypothetical protein